VNLVGGWVDFDFAAALGAPVRMLNDAAMQALGNYQGGRMLFLGFGTGMGSALIVDGVVQPLELAHLPYRKGKTYEEYVGAAGRARLGDPRWRHHCRQVAIMLRDALQVTDVVLGGGNAKRLRELPEGMRIGRGDAAFAGGLQMWSVTPPPEALP
jgi:polyphosphate glucokinase